MSIYLQDPDVQIQQGDALELLRGMPSGSVHMACTSPPFYGLRDYGMDGQIGLEATPDEWVTRLVDVFRELRRVLRDDGSLWLEIGDSYAGGPPGGPGKQDTNRGSFGIPARRHPFKPKDLIGAPWLLAFALRADGWYLRSEIIWAKPNPMPESVDDRPTQSHSRVFLLTKSARYFYDAEAIREPPEHPELMGQQRNVGKVAQRNGEVFGARGYEGRPDTYCNPAGRNRRSVWTIPTEPYPEAHFATWPTRLVEPMILAGTSERGVCAVCGAPWERTTELPDAYRALLTQRTRPEPLGQWLRDRRLEAGLSAKDLCGEIGAHGAVNHGGSVSNWENDASIPTASQWLELKRVLRFGDDKDASVAAWHEYESGAWHRPDVSPLEVGAAKQGPAATRSAVTTGWQPTCTHQADPVPATILDPFGGSGTTALVARKHGRRAILLELSPDYCKLAAERLSMPTELVEDQAAAARALQLSLLAGQDG